MFSIGRIAAALILAVGAWIRLAALETRSLSHPEMWAPLIPLPWELADPGVRPSLSEAVIHNLMADTHPPGYTIAMWFWMKLAGASVPALRLPSAFCGVGSIWLLWAAARRMRSRAPWLAPLLLACNGYAAMWSATARMYAPAAFAVLLATWILSLLEERWRNWLAAVYTAVLLASLSLHVYGWVFAGAHLLWSGPRDRRAAWWQMLAMIIGSPLLAFAAYQSFHPVAELSRNPLPFLAALAGFGAALPDPALIDIFDPDGQPAPWSAATAWAARRLVSRSRQGDGGGQPPSRGSRPRALRRSGSCRPPPSRARSFGSSFRGSRIRTAASTGRAPRAPFRGCSPPHGCHSGVSAGGSIFRCPTSCSARGLPFSPSRHSPSR